MGIYQPSKHCPACGATKCYWQTPPDVPQGTVLCDTCRLHAGTVCQAEVSGHPVAVRIDGCVGNCPGAGRIIMHGGHPASLCAGYRAKEEL